MKKLEIKRLVLGELETNCYIVIRGKECLIIDPASESDVIIQACLGYQVREILVTHHHFDHIGALEQIEAYYKLRHNNFKSDFSYQVLEMPGHAKDELVFYFPEDGIMFTGDFIFRGTIGRWDLYGGSILDMRDSLEKIEEYSDDIEIFPGHGEETTLGDEKRYFGLYY